MKNKLIKDFQKSLKKNQIAEFYNNIISNGLSKQFIHEAFLSTYSRAYEGILEDVSKFSLMLANPILKEKFGEELTDKMSSILYNTENIFLKNLNIMELVEFSFSAKTEEERNILNKILQMGENKDNILGVHISRDEIGDKISKEGLHLSGHSSVAFVKSNNEIRNKEDIMYTLSKNITFFDDDIIGLLVHMHKNRGYKNITGADKDMILVSIPKENLENNSYNIIEERDNGLAQFLNPQYIKGYAKVCYQTGSIAKFIDNPQYIEQTEEKQSNTEEKQNNNVEYWKGKLESWYKETNTTKFQRIKTNIIQKFKSLLHKDRENGEQALGGEEK